MAGHLKGPARWLAQATVWRDRLIARPSFQRWARRFAPTRPIARRRAGALFDLMAGFVYSQVLLACVRLEVFDLLADGPQPLPVLAAVWRLPEPAARRLVDAAVALRLLAWRGAGCVGLGPLGAPLVGNAGLAAMVLHHGALYEDLQDPVALLHRDGGGALAGYWPYAGDGDARGLASEQVAAYTALMAASQPLVAGEILDAYDFRRHRCVLDVAGGDGSFLAAVAERHPALQLQLFDLPAVVARPAPGLPQRAARFGGDFRLDPLPTGADLLTLVRVVHDHDDDTVRRLLRAAWQALPPGGVLLLAEPMAGTPGAQAMGDAYFGFYLLAMGRGRPRTAAALTALLAEAGFERIRPLRTGIPLQCSILRGCKS
ncbi:acetylserotonin O-methyltransferase [Aquincola sp. J276]|uniref:acetylserotonin O-methyltransferase n=1 Tax=Aquincola sp. J276 TaxID=2898432 RepID=UPI0021509BE3|nr:acetylserotonin O-methyltransferase [Aquincola sp. J276]MCR5868033.1 acetylserotonin O-methyltransferase [Aquincola sp. J276]